LTVLSQPSCQKFLVRQVECRFLLGLDVDGHCEAIGFPRAVSLLASEYGNLRMSLWRHGASKHATAFALKVCKNGPITLSRPVCPHVKSPEPLEGLHKVCYLGVSLKSVGILHFCLNSDNIDGCIT
jgi:hypothetical protein